MRRKRSVAVDERNAPVVRRITELKSTAPILGL